MPGLIKRPIVKVVGDACNLRCDYCFYHGKQEMKTVVMGIDLLESFLAQYFALYSGRLSFIWHGGEPLVAGVAFYEKVLEFQSRFKKDGDVVENRIQTNATLINDEWVKFFKRNNFRVGVSLDGGAESHNRHRKDAAGRNTFGRVLRGIHLLRQGGIEPGIIQTVTRSGALSLQKDMKFFLDEIKIKGWSMNLFVDGSSFSSLANEGLNEDDVCAIYEQAFKEWLARDNPNIVFREIENIIAGALGKRPSSCSFNGSCANFFCLDNRGYVWPCDRLSLDMRHLLGDLKTLPLSEVLYGDRALAHEQRASCRATQCTECRWEKVCNNGCTAARDERTGLSHFCKPRQKMFEAVEALLSKHSTVIP